MMYNIYENHEYDVHKLDNESVIYQENVHRLRVAEMIEKQSTNINIDTNTKQRII